jgi:hypothetical protein
MRLELRHVALERRHVTSYSVMGLVGSLTYEVTLRGENGEI